MMESTHDDKVLFVGGVWGNFIFRDFLFASDGMFSVGKILEMLAATKFKISELDEMLPVRYTHSIEVPVPWNCKGTVMRYAMQHSENMQRELVEGVKIFFDNNSVLLLPSKENPIFTVYSESDSYENCISFANKYAALVANWKNEA